MCAALLVPPRREAMKTHALRGKLCWTEPSLAGLDLKNRICYIMEISSGTLNISFPLQVEYKGFSSAFSYFWCIWYTQMIDIFNFEHTFPYPASYRNQGIRFFMSRLVKLIRWPTPAKGEQGDQQARHMWRTKHYKSISTSQRNPYLCGRRPEI